jgi:transposase
MVVETEGLECQTYVVGAACLAQELLRRLAVVATIDAALTAQPTVPATYGQLAQVLILNRMTLAPQPLYQLATWAAQHGIDRLCGLDAAWLDDDRLGAMLEALAAHQVTIWSQLVATACDQFPVAREWLHGDTTSIYFEGAYRPAGVGTPENQERVPRLVRGFNKEGHPENVQMVLSLVTAGRVPLWYRPWNGNQSDDAVYLADMTALREQLLAPDNAVLIGDRKMGNQATMLAFCRQGQQFLTAHAWTETVKALWLTTESQLTAGELAWEPVAYTSRNDAAKPPEQAPQYRVIEVEGELVDAARGTAYPLRWVFVHSREKAAQDAARREAAVAKGEAALAQVAGRLGKYDYKQRAVIESRLQAALRKAHAQPYLRYTLEGRDGSRDWVLRWEREAAALAEAARFDGVTVLCTNVRRERLPAPAAMVKYREQVRVEQTIDFLKSPVQIRPMWLHSPQRLAGLTLLIMIAVLVASLMEAQVRQWIADTGCLVTGLKPEGRDNAYPTATAILRAFADYTLVLLRHPSGQYTIHYPKLRPAQQQLWEILKLPPLPPKPLRVGSGK